MKTKALSQTNAFLMNAFIRDERIVTNVSSSTAIETGQSIDSIKLRLKKRKMPKDSSVKSA